MYRAFTLIEILLAMVMISILITIGLIVFNPSQPIAEVNNAQRQADVFSIYNAINQYRTDNAGEFPEGISTTAINICKPGCTESSSQIDITADISPYIRFGSIPVDPLQEDGSAVTGYTVYVSPQGRVVVESTLAENEAIINTIE